MFSSNESIRFPISYLNPKPSQPSLKTFLRNGASIPINRTAFGYFTVAADHRRWVEFIEIQSETKSLLKFDTSERQLKSKLTFSATKNQLNVCKKYQFHVLSNQFLMIFLSKGSTMANQNQTEREVRCFQYGQEIEEGIRKFIFTARGKLPKDEKELIKYCK